MNREKTQTQRKEPQEFQRHFVLPSSVLTRMAQAEGRAYRRIQEEQARKRMETPKQMAATCSS